MDNSYHIMIKNLINRIDRMEEDLVKLEDKVNDYNTINTKLTVSFEEFKEAQIKTLSQINEQLVLVNKTLQRHARLVDRFYLVCGLVGAVLLYFKNNILELLTKLFYTK